LKELLIEEMQSQVELTPIEGAKSSCDSATVRRRTSRKCGNTTTSFTVCFQSVMTATIAAIFRMNWRSSTTKPTLSISTPNQRACHSPVAAHETVKNFVDGGLTDRRIVVDGFSRISAIAGLIDSANLRDLSTRRVADPNWDRSQVSKSTIPSQSCQLVWLSFLAITPFTNQKFIEEQISSA
jgi:hypothetical protein